MQPKISLITSGNLYMRQMRFENVGDVEQGHVHTYDHITLLSKGKLEVITDDNTSGTIYSAPSAIKICTGVKHKLIAHEADTLAHCVHALRDAVTEDVLPANIVYTDQKIVPFKNEDGTVFVKPVNVLATVDDQPVEVAYIAKVCGPITETTFNMSKDSQPLKLVVPNT